MKILHVVAPARYGGLERVVQSLSAGQVAAGHDVEVAAVGNRPQDVEPFMLGLRDRGVSVRHLDVAGRAYVTERRRVRTTCTELVPDVVHTHGYRPDVVDGGAARSLGLPTVTTVHGFTGNGLKNRAYEWLQRRAFRRFDAVVAVSRPQVPLLRSAGVPEDRLHLVPNAMDPPEQLPPDEARERLDVPPELFHVGWVGRLSPEKGPDLLLAALGGVEASGAVVSIVGDGPMAPPLLKEAQAALPSHQIRWHGALPDAAAVLTAFDVLVISSRTEGTPMILLEAMHGGVPVVTTRVGGIPDVVSPDEAVLVAPDDPAALSAALNQVRDQPEAARRRARAARERARTEYGVESWVEQYDDVYAGAAGSGARTGARRRQRT